MSVFPTMSKLLFKPQWPSLGPLTVQQMYLPYWVNLWLFPTYRDNMIVKVGRILFGLVDAELEATSVYKRSTLILVYLSLRKPETSSTPPLVQDHVLLCHIRYSQYCMYINVGFHIHIRWEMGSTIQTILQENLYKCSKRDFVQWFPKCSTLYGTLMTWSKSSLTSLTALF